MEKLETRRCAHCSDILGASPVTVLDASYCCQGCRIAGENIGNQNLEYYYELMKSAGEKPPSVRLTEEHSSFLNALKNNPAAYSSVKAGVRKLTLQSPSLNCAACAWLLNRVLAPSTGLLSFEIDFLRGIMTLRLQEDADASKILETCAAWGYEFWPSDGSTAESFMPSRDLLVRLAVSFAAFANVMMFSSANYFGEFRGIEDRWKHFFEVMSLLVSLPATIYAGWPIFKDGFLSLKRGVIHYDLPAALGLAAILILSVQQFLTGSGALYFDSASGLTFFLLAGRWAVSTVRTRLAVDAKWIDSARSSTSRVWKENRWSDIPHNELKTGDKVMLKKGEASGADGILENDTAVFHTALITGESSDRRVNAGSPLFAGFVLTSPSAVFTVTHTGSENYLSELKDRADELAEDRAGLSHEGEKLAPYFTLAVILLSFIIFTATYLSSHSTSDSLRAAAVMLLITCPCALYLSLPISAGLVMHQLEILGVFIRRPGVLLRLSRVRHAVFDKTGTLSWTHKKLKSWLSAEESLTAETRSAFASLASLSLHPISRSLLTHLNIQPGYAVTGFKEFTGEGIEGFVGNVLYRIGSKAYLSRNNIETAEDASVYLAEGEKLTASVTFEDEVKPGARLMLDKLKSWGVKLHLFSGDTQKRTSDFAAELPFSQVLGGLKPAEKSSALLILKKDGSVFAMGDGQNDAQLLTCADVSAAVQGSALVCVRSADILLSAASVHQAAALFAASHRVRRSVRLTRSISLLYNIFAVYAAFLGYVTPLFAAILMPLSTLSVFITALIVTRINNNEG